MNPGKVARLEGRLAQVEGTAARLREALAQARAKADTEAEATDVEVVEAVAPPVKRKATKATRASKRAEG